MIIKKEIWVIIANYSTSTNFPFALKGKRFGAYLYFGFFSEETFG